MGKARQATTLMKCVQNVLQALFVKQEICKKVVFFRPLEVMVNNVE